MTTYTATVVSPVGSLTLVATGDALCELSWAGDKLATRGSLAANSVPDALHPVLARAMRELEEYFAGERRSFGVPVIAAGTGFQQSAWGVLRQIPYGETITYGEQARRVGNPRAVRAVGGANGRNPVGIIVPCHRVIGKSGNLTGYHWGLTRKRAMLGWEAGKVEA